MLAFYIWIGLMLYGLAYLFAGRILSHITRPAPIRSKVHGTPTGRMVTTYRLKCRHHHTRQRA